MKVNYRGFEVDVHRDKALGGWKQLFWSVFRLSDGWEFDSGFSCSDDTVRDYIAALKQRIDGDLADMGASTADEVSEEDYEALFKDRP